MSLLDPNDPTLIKIVHPSTRSSVTVSLKGATIVEWKIFSTNLLYLSPLADADVKSAVPIRGGIPLVFPNFGPTPANSSLPKHGFARTSQWTFVGTNVDENEDIIAIFQLEHSPQTLKVWPFKFQLQLQILLGMTYLQTSIQITNPQENGKEMPCQFLFHNYFHTDNLQQSVVTGLKDLPYTDIQTGAQVTERSALLPIVEQVDRIYRRHIYDDAAARFREEEMIALGDGGNADITLKAINLRDVVVWNPYGGLPDLPKDEYRNFVALELGTVSEKIKIESGSTFVGGQRLVLRILSKYSEEVRRQHAQQANQLMVEEKAKIQKILPAKSTSNDSPAQIEIVDDQDNGNGQKQDSDETTSAP